MCVEAWNARRVLAALPDIGSPGTSAFISVVTGFVWTAYAFGRRQGREDILWAAFVGTFVGVGIGLCLYAISLVIELAAEL